MPMVEGSAGAALDDVHAERLFCRSLLLMAASMGAQVCVPIDPSSVWDFDPEAVTTVHDLLEGDAGGAARLAASAAMEAALATFRGCFLTSLRAASKAALLARAKAAAVEGLAW